MTFRVRAALAPAFLAVSVLTACSSSSPRSAAAYVKATLSAGPSSSAQLCMFQGQEVVTLGTETSPTPTRSVDGDIASTGKASITCAVAAKGDGFDINLFASVAGMGTLGVNGHVTSKGGETVTAAFQTTGGSFKSDACTFTYTYSGAPVPTSNGPAIAAGRVWGHVSCPTAMQNSGQMVVLPDGTSVTRQCDAEADVLFEVCSQ
ncbi:MAG: hypothetical protein M3O50_22800 [Myxococcota bacterium]|nr:hypothetical protein [Myxococcota bacterium]